MKPYIYFEEEGHRWKVVLEEFEVEIKNRFAVPKDKRKEGLQLYTDDTFKKKINITGLVHRVEIITRKWWEFWK